MLYNTKNLRHAKNKYDKTQIEELINKIDEQINKIIYNICKFTSDEISLIEKN